MATTGSHAERERSQAPTASPSAAPPDSIHYRRCSNEQAAFPRTATYYLDQDRLPTANELARYDLVIIDAEWGHRVPRTFFAEVRATNPAVCLLAYVNLIDRPDRLGSREYWADRYALWQFHSDIETRFPRPWLATTADGTVVSEWPNTSMVNMTAHGPEVDGVSYPTYGAAWVADRIWDTGIWDGVLLDVWGDRIWTADAPAWDSNGDGLDEPENRIYGPGRPWARGLRMAEELLRSRMPDAVLVANGDRTLRDDLLNGLMWESFADPASGRSVRADILDYVNRSGPETHKRAPVAVNVNLRRASPGSVEDARSARFQLAATLMDDGFWAPMQRDYASVVEYPEMGGGVLPRGYLGRPLSENPRASDLKAPFDGRVGALASGLFRRDFEGGIVLLNASGRTHVVTLERSYQRTDGAWQAASREAVRSVAIPPRDGLVLIRG